MKRIKFVRSLMKFNLRVLAQGTPEPNKLQYTAKELKQMLFFNSVFISNTNEMFEKYNTLPIIDEYVEALTKYISNVAFILKSFLELNPSVGFTRLDSFERRFAIYKNTSDVKVSKFFKSISDVKYRFKSGQIYYISLYKNGMVGISSVDSNREIYNSPMLYQLQGKKIYLKTDDCIRDGIGSGSEVERCIAVKVTTSRYDPSVVTKVECNGKIESFKTLSPIFGDKALMVQNPFIYTDDITQMIDENMTESDTEEIQDFKSINAAKVFSYEELIEYPMDTFDDYLHFLSSSVLNPETKEIFITLYRIGSDPAIFYILRSAVEKGIKVHVNIELMASGEDVNRIWRDEMIAAGIKVTTYACGILKVHSKLTLVKFNNGQSVAQIGTGNYHTKTTTQYTDLSLITANEDVCYQIEKLFNVFKGVNNISFSENLLVTRFNARDELVRLIDDECEKGKEGFIFIKCNTLDDDEIIDHLNSAAEAGCHIHLIIRGACTWAPYEIGINVLIESMVWDKLEHSRVYCFGKGDPSMYIGSLDLVTSKLDKRIETMVKVTDPNTLIKMCAYINRYITTAKGKWVMDRNGNYTKEDPYVISAL